MYYLNCFKIMRRQSFTINFLTLYTSVLHCAVEEINPILQRKQSSFLWLIVIIKIFSCVY